MIASDPLHHHGGVKALTGHVLLQAMGQLEQRTADIQAPSLLILGGGGQDLQRGGLQGDDSMNSIFANPTVFNGMRNEKLMMNGMIF